MYIHEIRCNIYESSWAAACLSCDTCGQVREGGREGGREGVRVVGEG